MEKIYGSLWHREKKLIYLFLPKCGGCSHVEYLHSLSNEWETAPITNISNTDIQEQYYNYTIFTSVRHPVDWTYSGFKMFSQRHNLPFDFTKHLETINNPINLIDNPSYNWKNYWWHCGITPDYHILKYPNVQVFKLENNNRLQVWMLQHFTDAFKHEFPHSNKTLPVDLNLTSYQKKLIRHKFSEYARKFDYKLP